MEKTRLIYSVKEITRRMKDLFEQNEDLQDVWVRGELSNFTHHSSGHMYFTIKDEGSRMKAVMFAGNNRYLRFIPKNGARVIIRGSITIYERDGQYQLYAREMQPDGIGSLYLAFEQLKEKLAQEGLFDPTHKKPIPVFPKTIGVITSPTGAAIRDIITTIRRRYPLGRVLLLPVLVQGEQAAGSISRAIQEMNRRMEVDVLIIGRGGGSIEELWAFNEEIVARSIFQSKIPVISAVGHETDFTISDFVADIRAATPTAAAEIAVPHLHELREKILRLQGRMSTAMKQQLRDQRNRLERAKKSYVFRQPGQQVYQYQQALDRLQDRLKGAMAQKSLGQRNRWKENYRMLLTFTPQAKLQGLAKQNEQIRHRLHRAMVTLWKDHARQTDHLIGKLDALSPLKVMGRGYALVFQEEEKKTLVKSIGDVDPGKQILVRLHDGELTCTVNGKKEGDIHGEKRS